MNRLFVATGFCLLLSCNVSNNTNTTSKKHFFDLAAYMEQQVETAPWASSTITKTITLEDKTERREVNANELHQDLVLFSDADINKTSWVEKYRLDIMGNDTSYIAIDSSMQTQRLEVLRNELNEVTEVIIERKGGSLLSQRSQQLVYKPSEGYSIVADQKSDLLGNTKVSVVVEF